MLGTFACERTTTSRLVVRRTCGVPRNLGGFFLRLAFRLLANEEGAIFYRNDPVHVAGPSGALHPVRQRARLHAQRRGMGRRLRALRWLLHLKMRDGGVVVWN